MGRLVTTWSYRSVAIAGTGAALLVLQVLTGAQVRQPAGAVIAAHERIDLQTSDNCMACHNGMTTAEGEDVSIGVAWRASMMANSSRDPYWQAAVRRETLDHPSKKAEIEDECAICHMPMARAVARSEGRHAEVFSKLPWRTGDSEEHRLAADGVSCTLCHQITPERLGTRESFVGGFVLRPPEKEGARMFGPYEVDAGRTRIMRSSTGVQPTKAEHVQQSELCATCHTLYTEALNPQGQVAGTLPEQVPYLEWQHSTYGKDRSCQSCHMPRTSDTRIASVLGEPREHLSRHTFLGGNFFMLRMLNRFRNDLKVTAPPQELEAAARATIRQLQTDTATVAVSQGRLADGMLSAVVSVRNLTGHKLPTGYPSRRVWLHVVVRDREGKTVFESGALASSGRIAGNDNDEDAARFEPHHVEIRTSNDVQIYESIMATPEGAVTTGLLRATQFVKDNRLLPEGFDKGSAIADIAVRGPAAQDADFTAAGDEVRYVVPVGSAQGPFEIDAELRYQPIGFRWADNLRSYDAVEPRRFVSFFDATAPGSSSVLARAVATVR